ncbi:unnamed protein product [Caenorhabditis auriculariae]|uniref:SXP/RAL-2 family protein Ani s 5-like cation-binding domain-containing protein n=1 Tax=Caenorhabditis auriculariae TaxID=2777116 RepID=A0A8S1HIC0_9PELO|nr:unnamed protein product [Caenorhabditis auriculariae]
MRLLLAFLLLPPTNSAADFEKYGKRVTLSTSTMTFQDWYDQNREHSRNNDTTVGDFNTQLKRSLEQTTEYQNKTFMQQLIDERNKYLEKLNEGHYITDHRRLVDELLDPNFYEKTVHPKSIRRLDPTPPAPQKKGGLPPETAAYPPKSGASPKKSAPPQKDCLPLKLRPTALPLKKIAAYYPPKRGT